jgi:hypothetical protein
MGSSPHKHNVQTISRAGCGAVEYVGPSYPLSRQDDKQLGRALQPSLGAISAEWIGCGADQQPRQAPETILSLFSGERTIIYAFVPPGCTSVRISAKDSLSSQNYCATAASSPTTVTRGLAIHRLCTRAVVRDWDSGNLGDSTVSAEIEKERRKQEIIDLGCLYSLATPLTSFIAVEERSEAEKAGRTILPPTPPLSTIDKLRVDEIPHCSAWEKIEKATVLIPSERPKIGDGPHMAHQTIYDFWQPAKESKAKANGRGRLAVHSHRRRKDRSDLASDSSSESEDLANDGVAFDDEVVATKKRRAKGKEVMPAPTLSGGKHKKEEKSKRKMAKSSKRGAAMCTTSSMAISSAESAAQQSVACALPLPSPQLQPLPPSAKVTEPRSSRMADKDGKDALLGMVRSGKALKKTETAAATMVAAKPQAKPKPVAVAAPPPPPPPLKTAAPAGRGAPPPLPAQAPRAPGAMAAGGSLGIDADIQELREGYRDLEEEVLRQSIAISELEMCCDRLDTNHTLAKRSYMSKSAARCFIATAAYGTPLDPRIDSLRWFRDHVLELTAPGRAFIRAYYTLSPPFAKWLTGQPLARAVVRTLLWPLVFIIDHPLAILFLLLSVVIAIVVNCCC